MNKQPTYEELEQRVVDLKKENIKLKRSDGLLRDQKRTEAALRESEEKYRLLFESAQDGIVVVNKKGNFLCANEAAARNLGYNEEEFLELNIVDIEAKESKDEFEEHFSTMLKGRRLNFETLHRKKDGSLINVDVSLNIFDFKGEKVTYSFWRNITNRKQAEAAVRESEEKFSKVFHSGPMVVSITSLEEGRYIEINDAFERFTGYTHEETVGATSMELDLWVDLIDRDRMVKALIRDGLISDFETRVRSKSGEIRTGIMSAELIKLDDQTRIISTIIDITERKRAEEALRESEIRLREREKLYNKLFETCPEGIVMGALDGKIEFVNQAFIDQLGYTREELINKLFYEITPEKWHKQEAELVAYVIETGKHASFEKEYINKNGTVFPVKINGWCIMDEDGQPQNIGAFVKDITNQKQAEEGRKNLESRLQQAQKMESIGTLAGGIAHDFNNILSPVMIHSEMAKMGLPPDSPVQNNLREIYNAGVRARDMVKQILTFSRKKEGDRAEIKIIPVLKEVLKMLRSTMPTTIDIQQNLEAESDTILADPTQIHQIMLNLGTNASHAMREKGGILKVSLVQEDLDSEATERYSDLNPGPYLRLTVRDTGSGIDVETMQKIFEPYFTTKEVGEGTGMGLALIHGIVKSYGGDITVESEPGKGTTFNVYLPRIEADALPVEASSVQIPMGTERILFVDDEKAAVNAVQPMLEYLGYKVIARTSSIGALEAFRNNPQGFDLVITDMTMPNMTGKDLAKELMIIRPDIPIILCTGFSEKIDEIKAKEMGIFFVMKPIALSQISNTIRKVLDKK